MKPLVEFAAVNHRYGDMLALSNVSFTMKRHEFVAVVGPSGCGKSTLLRLLSGLMLPSEGAVNLFGAPVAGPREDVGIVFQKPALLPWKNVLDNVLFPLRHKFGRVSQAQRQQALELISMVGLESFVKKMPDQLSGGMQQRVGIARALLLEPEILILDEPFSALDALTREQMGFDLLRLWHKKPKSVLFITHAISEAVLLADKVLIFSERPGTIVRELSIDLPRPRDIYTLQTREYSDYTRSIREQIFANQRPDRTSPSALTAA